MQEISKQNHDQKSLLTNIDPYFASFPRMQRVPHVECTNLRDGVFFLVKDITGTEKKSASFKKSGFRRNDYIPFLIQLFLAFEEF